MASSDDDEGEIAIDSVTNYQFRNSQNAPISFSILPLHWNNNDHEQAIENGESSVALLGMADGGLQSVYTEVIGWKVELSYAVPEVYMLSKGKKWIKLQKPRKCYGDVIRSVLIVIRCLHFAKRNVHATRNDIWSHLQKTLRSFSHDLVESLENCLSAHLPLIRSAVAKDKDLAKSKRFLWKLRILGLGEEKLFMRNFSLSFALKDKRTSNKSKFIASDDDDENDEDFDDESEDPFDSVCAFCDNGGDVLICEGQCLRSFHPTVDAGVETCCESLGFKNAAEYEAIETYLCDNCKHQKHQCFVCGLLGSSDKSSAVEVFPCASATCGHFYHPKCVANSLYPSDKILAKQLKSQIAAGESFTCPIHKCRSCQQGENKDEYELQFAICRRCPEAYHRKCLPKEIAFDDSADGTIQQSAWDGLLPKRILMYCMKHTIIPSIATPKRDHLLFPFFEWKRDQEGSRRYMMVERRSKSFGNLKGQDTKKMPMEIERRYSTVAYGDTPPVKGKSSTMHKMRSSFDDNKSISGNLERPSNKIRSKPPYKDTHREQRFTSKPVEKTVVSALPKVDADMKTRILKLMEDSASSFDAEEFIKEKKRRCTSEIYTPQYGLDKTITMGKVEASVKAVKAAVKILEDGGSIEDAKAVCEPNILNQLIRWRNKLNVFLAPFLHGARYTPFGRHFTKADKLKEIVDRLHWYVEDGDTIVDFCCGSNDFSCFMKEKLDTMGKRCKFKNYDLFTPQKTFNFEKRDWFSVPVEALPDGSRLVMGLNPPFGVRASLANKFINHALKFKPKLIILIVPKETKRLDRKIPPYDLIWEDCGMLSDKSFYLPGSLDTKAQPLDDWNVKPPPLSLWSRPDWTAKHIQVAEKHSHIVHQKQNEPHTLDGVVDMDLSSDLGPVASSTNPLCNQPSYLGQSSGFVPPHDATTSVQYGNYGPGIGYTQSGQHANYGFPGSTFYHGQPNYGYPGSTYYYGQQPNSAYPPSSSIHLQGPTSTIHSRPDFTSMGTTPPNHRYNSN
ncbi:hypothetical protein SSX86_006681 [Deinandra increscens subsp. villosa]|uniref:Zinc finger PHD-type domain-containing protein n=1 Tax=Deinandra increscens subsp. villosa TaxID=3103831 RepID=A0AAP0H5W3_9ASTR